MDFSRLATRLLTLTAGLAALSCSDLSGPTRSEMMYGAGAQACTAGSTTACPCADGTYGVSQCDGAGWTQCNCPSGAEAVAGTPLPCDIAGIIARNCQECHGAQPQFGAPMSLVTTEDFHKPAATDPSRAVAELVRDRIGSEVSRMPPPPKPMLPDGERGALESWIGSGAPPAGAMDACTPAGSGGSTGEGGSGVGGSGVGGSGVGGSGVGGSGVGGSGVGGSGGYSVGGSGGVGGEGGVGGTAGYGVGGAGGSTPTDMPADCQDHFDLRAHGQPIPNDTMPYQVPKNPADSGNQYMCFYFDPPYQGDPQALAFRSILDDTRVLHHWLLYGTDNKTHQHGDIAPCSAAEPGAYLIAGWAPGGTDVTMPPDVGMDLPSGPNGGLILEVHYFNAQQLDAVDQSGVRFCTAPANTRPHTAAVHFLGSEAICLPPRAPASVQGPCVPRTDMGDIHIVNVWPHMHKHGRGMTTLIHRANGTTETLHDQPFDFNAQINYPKGDVVIHPGDTLENFCHFENTTDQAVHFGDRTQDEMCYQFVTAWPAGSLGPDPFTATFNPIAWVQPQRRCMDLTSILGSCNGLADYPQP